MKTVEAERLLTNVPRKEIGAFPTPLLKLANLSKKYGVNIYMKRDDLSGPEFGGNKIRKLEFLLADAIQKKAEYVFTYGAHQTNHGRETVAACRKLGLKPVLYLVYLGGSEQPEECKGNLLLDRIMDAEIHYVSPTQGLSAYEAVENSYSLGAEHMNRLEKEGRRCYNIPVGGFNLLGSLGFLSGFVELAKQTEERSIALDSIFHATGSGGTLAGLWAGKKLLDSAVQIVPVSVDREPKDKKRVIADMADEVLRFLGSNKRTDEREVSIDTAYYGEGYEMPSKASTDAIRELAMEEGIVLDPVYTSKAMSGLIDHLKKGQIREGGNVLFWHTGGTPAVFAEKEIVGDL